MRSKINLKFYRETMESSGWTMTTSGESIATWLCATCLQTSTTMELATEQVSYLVAPLILVRWTAFFKIAKKKTLHGFYLLFDDITEYQMSFKGSWKTSLNAGGWLECESFYQNPQYLITLHTDGKVLLFICFFFPIKYIKYQRKTFCLHICFWFNVKRDFVKLSDYLIM